MTLKQLVDKYRFEEIIPELRELWDKGNLYLFRQALDILRSMAPAEGRGGVIDVVRVEGVESAYNRVSNLSGRGWAESLNYEINVDSGCILTEKQLLALCLWERTFYGFSPRQQAETFRRWDAESDSDCADIDEKSERAGLIEDICAKYPSVKPEDLKFLLTDQAVIFLCFDGLISETNRAVDYIVESITRYSDLPIVENSTNCVVLLRMPQGSILPSGYKEKLLEAVKVKMGFEPKRVYLRAATDSSAMSVTIVYPNQG